MIPTLETFEHDLQHERGDKLLYLDSFFPRFLKGFLLLYCAAAKFALCPAQKRLHAGFGSTYLAHLSKIRERIRMWQTQINQIIKAPASFRRSWCIR